METVTQIPDMYELSRTFKALGDQTRLKVAYAIAQHDLAVQEVADLLGTTIQNASSHLRQLKFAGLATSRRNGKQIHYRLAPKAVDAITTMRELCQ